MTPHQKKAVVNSIANQCNTLYEKSSENNNFKGKVVLIPHGISAL